MAPFAHPPDLRATTFGVRVGLRLERPSLVPKVAAYLPLDWHSSDGSDVDHLYSFGGGDLIPGTRIRRFFVGFRGADNFVRTLNEEEALLALQDAIHSDVALSTSSFTFVHAGVVGWKERAIVVPGETRSGKSQLVLALLRAGATYYSDDMAAIDASGCVHRVSRTIGLRDAQGASCATTLESLGVSPGHTPLRIRAVVSTRYVPGADWRPREGTAGEAMMALFAHAGRARIAPAGVMQMLASAVAGATFIESPRDEADAAAVALLRFLDGRPYH